MIRVGDGISQIFERKSYVPVYWCSRVGETGPVGDWLGGGGQIHVRRRRRNALRSAELCREVSLENELPSLGQLKSGSTREAEFKGSGVSDGWGTLGKFVSLFVPQLPHAKNEDGSGLCFSKVRHGIVALKSNVVPSTQQPGKDWIL